MPRPDNKLSLLQQAEQAFDKVSALLNEIPSKQLDFEFPEGMLNRNIRDVIGHLTAWHNLFLDWYQTGMQGGKPQMPAIGFSWKETPQLNKLIQKQYEIKSLNIVFEEFKISHTALMRIIAGHSNEELFTKKFLKWTGSTSLGSYLVSATSSHYNWAYKLIVDCLKKQKIVIGA